MSKQTFPPCSVCGQPSTCNFEQSGNGRRVYFCAGHGQAFVRTMKANGATVSYTDAPARRAAPRKRSSAPAAPARREVSGGSLLYQLLGAAAIVVVVMTLLLVLTGGLK